MVGVGGGHAHGALHVPDRVGGGVGLRALDAPFHLADGVQILAHPRLIGRAELLVELGELVHHGIEQAGPALQGSAALGRVRAVAEQPLEHDPRVGLAGQRRGRRGPRQAVVVDAGVAVVALAGQRHQVHGQFQRRQLRIPAELPGCKLVGRGAQEIVRAFGEFGPRGAQERGVGGCVRAGVGIPQFEVAEHRDVLLYRGQRGENETQLIEALAARRRPAQPVAAHRDVDVAEAAQSLRGGRRFRQRGHARNHGIEQRQRQYRSRPAQKGPPRQRFLGNDHCDLLI